MELLATINSSSTPVTFKSRRREMLEISRYLEYGTYIIPPRPLFREVLHEFKNKEEIYYTMFKEGRK